MFRKFNTPRVLQHKTFLTGSRATPLFGQKRQAPSAPHGCSPARKPSRPSRTASHAFALPSVPALKDASEEESFDGFSQSSIKQNEDRGQQAGLQALASFLLDSEFCPLFDFGLSPQRSQADCLLGRTWAARSATSGRRWRLQQDYVAARPLGIKGISAEIPAASGILRNGFLRVLGVQDLTVAGRRVVPSRLASQRSRAVLKLMERSLEMMILYGVLRHVATGSSKRALQSLCCSFKICCAAAEAARQQEVVQELLESMKTTSQDCLSIQHPAKVARGFVWWRVVRIRLRISCAQNCGGGTSHARLQAQSSGFRDACEQVRSRAEQPSGARKRRCSKG